MDDQTPEATDIFLWANQTDAIKNDLHIEVFLFNKLYTPFSVRYSDSLMQQLRALFLYDVVNDINLGAGIGMSVREFEQSEKEENVLLHTVTTKVDKARTLLAMIQTQRSEIVEFNEEEHEFKRMKGIIVRFTDIKKKVAPFYIAKALPASSALNRSMSWEINGSKLDTFKADVGLKIPTDNQVLIAGEDIFIFNQPKFEKLFQYEYKKQLLADQKASEIEAKYKLSFPEGQDLQTMVRERPRLISKLQKLEIGAVAQDKALDYADTMQLELMTDDAGAIIIFDGKDLDTFVNLINEDYITSEITGKRYEIKSKKLLDEPEAGLPSS